MSLYSPRNKGFLLIGVTLASIAIGIRYLSPNIDGGKFVGGFLGFILARLLSHVFFPELRKSSNNIWNGNNILGANMKTYFTHPTQIPLMMGMLWFCIVLLFMYLFGLRVTTDSETRVFMGTLIPSFLLFGISGFLMIKRKETVGKLGAVYTGFWAYLNGVLGIIFGWGIGILLVLSLIFKW